MDEVSLQKRTDTKFLIAYNDINSILKELKDDYFVLEINERRMMNYSSLYFDTNELKFYYDHHRGKTNRIKIRQRKYVDSDLTFLEIKRKNGKGETIKSRTKIDDFQPELNKELSTFVTSKTELDLDLKPSLMNKFHRITLVNTRDVERITIDIGLSYSKKSKNKKYDNLVIIEVKQSKFNRESKIVKLLREFNYYPYSISKYCIGIINLYNDVKSNLFKKKLLKVNQTIS